MPASRAPDDPAVVDAARQGDAGAFERLAGAHRRELAAHSYRMLGSIQDAEDAVQEALLAAWRGIGKFEGRSSVRSWLFRITTNACLRMIERRPPRLRSSDHGPSFHQTAHLGDPVPGPVWLEPWPGDVADSAADPAAAVQQRRGVELAYVAALQHLPGTQRAVLLMREVLDFSAAEVAEALDTTPASVNSALQRARQTVAERVPPVDQQSELAALGDTGRRELVDSFIAAWERADVTALIGLLSDDARFTMPPLPAWFDGRDDVMRFITERAFETPWRWVPIEANAQPAFACYQAPAGTDDFRLGAITLLGVRGGRIAEIASFLEPALHRHFGLPERLPQPGGSATM